MHLAAIIRCTDRPVHKFYEKTIAALTGSEHAVLHLAFTGYSKIDAISEQAIASEKIKGQTYINCHTPHLCLERIILHSYTIYIHLIYAFICV